MKKTDKPVSSLPALTKFLEEFADNNQAITQRVQESRLFFQLTHDCQFFDFMKPTASVPVSRQSCPSCKNDGFLRHDPLANHDAFDIGKRL